MHASRQKWFGCQNAIKIHGLLIGDSTTDLPMIPATATLPTSRPSTSQPTNLLPCQPPDLPTFDQPTCSPLDIPTGQPATWRILQSNRPLPFTSLTSIFSGLRPWRSGSQSVHLCIRLSFNSTAHLPMRASFLAHVPLSNCPFVHASGS